jgi:uncharacterized RDD family membrane protein YckC
VKCPKCGFVSFPGISQCKKCGHHFAPEAPAAQSSDLLSVVPKSEPWRSQASPPAPPGDENPAPLVEAQPLEPSGGVPELPEVAAEPMNPPPAAEDWRQELSGRVENFRRKRANLRKGFDPGSSLELEFDPAVEGEEAVGEAEVLATPEPQEVDTDLSRSEEIPLLESLPLEKSGEGMRVLSSAAVEAGETSLEPPEVESEPVEIVVEPSSPRAAAGPEEVASLGARLAAALADGMVLAVAGGLFGAIFWTAGGRLSPTPLNIVVLGFLAALTLLAYFGLFTALAAATPGLVWMRLQVRNSYGNPPTTSESFWRAFGYLVSLASLLLGFVWALVDSDKMTWHDHMSGTYIASAR